MRGLALRAIPSGPQAHRAAHKGVTALIEAQDAMSRVSNADPWTPANDQKGCPCGGTGCPSLRAQPRRVTGDTFCPDLLAEPERAGHTEIAAIQPSVNVQCASQPARAARQVEQLPHLAIGLHSRNPSERFERTDEYPATDARRFTADVEHEVISITEIDIGVTAMEKHGAIARRGTTEMVSRGVSRRIGLRFDDAARQPLAIQFAHDDFADEKSSQSNGVGRQFVAAETTDKQAKRLIGTDCI